MVTEVPIMADVKDWVLTKCRDAGTFLSVDRLPGGSLPFSQNNRLSISSIVVTPENIPPFTIPSCESTNSVSPDSEVSFSSSKDSLACPPSPTHSLHHLSPSPSPRSSRSAPVSPLHSVQVSPNCGDVERVLPSNGTPRTALSLPHLQTRTDFGFETLKESPHTRRKESLFHDDQRGAGTTQRTPGFALRHSYKLQGKTTGSLDSLSLSEGDSARVDTLGTSSFSPNKLRRNKRRNVPPLIAPLGVVLAPTSHGGLGHLALLPSSKSESSHQTPLLTQNVRTLGAKEKQIRRRSSLIEDFSISGDSANLAKEIAGLPRRGSNTLVPSLDESKNFLENKKLGKMNKCQGVGILPCICHRLGHCDKYNFGLGLLRLSLHYHRKLRQLKVGVLRAENIGGIKKTPLEVNSFVKLYLMPGKLQKQTSRQVKQTKDPVYNQDFVFQGIEPQQVGRMKLHVKLFTKGTKLGREEQAGEIQVPLDNLNLSSEVRLLRALEPAPSKQELGYIQVSICFYASAEKLTLTIHKVTDLARHPFTGAPDPYVRADLEQPGRPLGRQQTRIKKKTTMAEYEETFTFTISPKVEDLSLTSLDLTVLDHGLLRSDAALGQMKLGLRATEQSEFDHWNRTLQNPGKVTTAWHMLMDASE